MLQLQILGKHVINNSCFFCVKFGRTDQVKNSLNPDFSKPLLVDYYFEMVQKLKFMVYDVDNATKRLDDDDFLGEMECTLGQVDGVHDFLIFFFKCCWY